MNAIGDMGAFQAYQLGNAMPEAAANPAGGLAGAGVGLGMGLAMTNSMGGLMPSTGGSTDSGGGPAVTPPPLPASSTWHIAEGGQAVGPFSAEQIAPAVATGRIARDTLVWTVGMSEWSAASRVGALAHLFAPQPPPLPDA